MSRTRNRSGFALPITLLILAFLTVGVATSFARVQSELHAEQSLDVRTDAFLMAQTGLERFAVERTSMGFTSNPPAQVESVRVMLAGGWADVVARRVRPKNGAVPAVYLLKSKGTRVTGSMPWMPRAEHVVAQYAVFREGSMNVLSAWTSLSGLHKNGSSGTIDGTNACGVMPPVAGVAVPDVPAYTQSGGGTVPTGSPPIDSLGTQTQANNAVRIDWDGIVNHNAIPADVTSRRSPGLQA